MSTSVWRRWLFRLALAGVLAAGMGYLPYQIYGPGGISRVLRLERQLQELLAKNARLQRDNRALRVQIHGLQTDRAVIERVARDELSLVHSDDIVFQLQP